MKIQKKKFPEASLHPDYETSKSGIPLTCHSRSSPFIDIWFRTACLIFSSARTKHPRAMASREPGMGGMAGFRASMYNIFMKRNSVYVTVCLVGSYAATHLYLNGTDKIWKRINKGVSFIIHTKKSSAVTKQKKKS